MGRQRTQATVLSGGSATRTGCGVRDGAGCAEDAVCSRRSVVGRAGKGVGVTKRRCGTCRFFQEAGLAGSGWCHHPQRKTTSDLLIMVRRNELACRDQWERDLWEGAGRNADGERSPFSDGARTAPVQPATPGEIAAVVQADAWEATDAAGASVGAPSAPALEDVMLSETGVGRAAAGGAAAVPLPPAWSWRVEEAEETSAVREIDARAAIKKAREAYRDRNRRAGRGEADEPFDETDEPMVVGSQPSAGQPEEDGGELAVSGERSEAIEPAEIVAVESGDGEDSLAATDQPGVEDQDSAQEGTRSRKKDWIAEGVGPGEEGSAESFSVAAESGPEDAAGETTDVGRRRVFAPGRSGEQPPARASLFAERPLLSTVRPAADVAGQRQPRLWRFERRERPRPPETLEAVDDGFEEEALVGAEGNEAPAENEFQNEEGLDWEDKSAGSAASATKAAEGGLEEDALNQGTQDPSEQTAEVEGELGDDLVAVAWGGNLPRVCRTCRDFRPAEGGTRGWCANQWAFSHRRVVAAEDATPCESSFGSWWLPVDEVWAGGVDVASHGQPTPLLDAFLPQHRDEPRRERRRGG